MSLFRLSSGGDSISEIKGGTTEEQLVAAVNQCRLNPSCMYQWIDRLFEERIDWSSMQIDMKEFGQAIRLESKDQVAQAKRYFSALSEITYVLSDLCYNEQLNASFAKAILSAPG